MQELRQLTLDADEAQARHMAGLKFHEYVDVAVGAEVVPKHRPEQREPSDVMPPAKRRDGSRQGRFGNSTVKVVPDSADERT